MSLFGSCAVTLVGEVLANREVEIRPARGGAPGSRTDIQVEAIPPGDDAGDVVRLIIEVKGCWHRDLMTAMATQLVHSYLRGSGMTHGLYLVIWCECPVWSSGDWRQGATERLGLTLDDARSSFEKQALEASEGAVTVRSMVLDARWPTKDFDPKTQRT